MAEENEDDLRRLNEQIPLEENGGHRKFFDDRLASVFAMHRVDGTLADRDLYLDFLKDGGQRACDPRSIEIRRIGALRALVDCVVTNEKGRFHNTRLFVKGDDGRWKMLAWANETL